MSGKISTEWDEDIYGNSLLLVRKNRGKLNLDEVLDAIRYDWRIQGHYVMILNATEATCGVGWDLFGEEKKGDEWELYKVEEGEKCPVCNKVSPLMGSIARSAAMNYWKNILKIEVSEANPRQSWMQ